MQTITPCSSHFTLYDILFAPFAHLNSRFMAHIHIEGARTHTLKNITVDIPRDQLTVITGLSGSGKSSLAFDTLYAEGQRRYVESLSAYARQFLSMMDKPDVTLIEGLSPAIAIEQKASSHNPRSTVGTITEIYDYLRLLFARIGTPHCPTHHHALHAQTISQMVDEILLLPENSKAMILAPIIRNRKGEHLQKLKQLQAQGFIRARINGDLYELDDPPTLALHEKHTIEVVVDRFKIHPDLAQRLSESCETATRLSEGLVSIVSLDHLFPERVFSTRYACPTCGYSISELEPRFFSFNSPTGACPTCDGLGIQPSHAHRDASHRHQAHHLISPPCDTCHGKRLNQAAQHVLISRHSLPTFTEWSITKLFDALNALQLPGAQGAIAAPILKEILARLCFLKEVGLHYLTLSRSAETLSGGETQRIRLASQIGSGLVGVMYILDEPSIGLHQRDNARLLDTLKKLRDLGNTVIVVEHDEDAIRAADYVLDMGPGAGIHGGTVVAQGTPAEIQQHPQSLTGHYLSGQQAIEIPIDRLSPDPDKWIRLEAVSCHNLKQVSAAFPIGLLTCITGVSGSGKSTLINDTLYPFAANQLNGAKLCLPGHVKHVTGLEWLDKVIDIDQAPIGRTPRSNPATYTGLFTPIRELFAQTPEARARGYSPGRFSFNVKGGRCEACEGDGVIQVAMHFLPDIYVPCDVCRGQRYNRETLSITYKGRNIHEVLCLTIEEATAFFSAIPSIAQKCQTLVEVGLGYLSLGQSATTLSGGEAQRIKLAKELSKRATGRTLYILDEPTTGLHFHDVKQLLQVLHRLKARGNTLLIIEHHLDVIKTADWVVDLGPEGGDEGGQIIATGTPEHVAQQPHSHTGRFLQPLL